jgi:DNA-binding NtrC family response regulator
MAAGRRHVGMSRGKIILVDDDDGSRVAMATGLRRVGYEVVEVDGGDEAVALLDSDEPVDALITDVRMPGMNGYEVLRRARASRPSIAILMVTAFGDVDGAVKALQDGADDYLTKPVNLIELRRRVETQLENRLLNREARELKERLDKTFGFENIIGRSRSMEQLLERVRVVAPAPTTVLIVGESGTGKELIANAIHQHSARVNGKFVALNCGAIPGEILEAELFGHERGAFTGAHQRRIGKIELAHGGSLFLDEISELSPDLQVKLLRVLEERRIVRVGGNDEIPVDFRLITATNRDLDREVESGRFRQDLYYRLKVVTLKVPPLRERPEDIPALVNHFTERFNRDLGRTVRKIAPQLSVTLSQYAWPGNVRELRNVVENMVLFTRGDELTLADLPPDFGGRSRPGPRSEEGEWQPRTMAEIEKEAIVRALEHTGGHRAKAAQLLDIGLRTLQRKLKEYGAVSDGAE